MRYVISLYQSLNLSNSEEEASDGAQTPAPATPQTRWLLQYRESAIGTHHANHNTTINVI